MPIYHGDPVLTYLDSDVMSYETSLPMPSRGQARSDDKTADDKPAEDNPAMSSSSPPMSRLLTTSPLMQAC